VLLDDRNERLGSKFQDADLIGSPVVIIVGKFIEENKIEIYNRVINKKNVIKDDIDAVQSLVK
jgi:prolyl-tRNA synthetase